jgi:hypothetical protein
MLVDIGELIRQGKLVRGTITITQLGIAEDDAGLADAQKWVAGRTLGMSEFAFAFLQMEPEGEEAESEEAREEEEKADEQRDFELEPWRNPNAIPPVEIDPLYEDPAMALEEEYASMVPDLEGETDGARLANAVRSVSSMEGTPEEKAETMRQYAAQIRLRSGGSWEYDTGRGTDGSYVFIGSAGYKPTHVVVISPQGNVYTGGYTGFTFSGSGVTPRYDILRPAPK